MLALQLLQNSLVYFNTPMLQCVLGERYWLEQMGAEDWCALSPLFYSHVNPYGLVSIDMAKRLSYLAAMGWIENESRIPTTDYVGKGS
jgi:hypothetical protein